MKRLPKIRITVPFCVLISVMYVLDCEKVFLPTLLAVGIHEAAHIIAILVTRGRIERIDVRAFGVSVKVEGIEYMPYSKEIIIAAAGPLAGILTAVVSLVAAKSFRLDSLWFFIGVNIIITAINLIPVYPLDGGRIVLCIMLKFLSVRAAYSILYALSAVFIGILCGLCFYVASVGELNPSLVLFSLYVAACGIKAPRF